MGRRSARTTVGVGDHESKAGIQNVTAACEHEVFGLFETLNVSDQRLQIIWWQVHRGHAARVHLCGGMLKKFSQLSGWRLSRDANESRSRGRTHPAKKEGKNFYILSCVEHIFF